ncbi:AfsR/SARP family transcriptional regulator [Wenjunlia tyrosinilytica]|uniref:AfsR/SARP family transcriptional regulator n=1 Tax=Wenjunlia tyrosinilytica TaxID=1544741 RepID=UPI00166E211C|nr:BTAD domain-containing putative transcriptional regulator [Wenjunlia tyrosinilytica]
MAVEFGVLGSIEARVDGGLVELGHARQRLLLAALLVDLGREVSIEELAERIWGESQAQRGTLYGYLSRLRRALAAVEGVEITRRPAGYVLTAGAAVVDLHRFRDLVDRARAAEDDAQAANLFGQALDLWRGEALATMDTAWAGTVREELHQERLAAELDRTEARLRLGQHLDLVAGLRARTKEHPWDERLAGQLMLALYRCGRATEALAHYQHTRRRLAKELGIDPGPELRRLHQQILTGDCALTPRAGVAPAAPVPRQLPAPPALFTGRERELAALTAGANGAGGTVVVSAIGGTGGIGKTHLALHWAYRHLDRFGDGQLYVNLRGFDPSEEPLTPSAAIRGFLDALGVASGAVPPDPDARVALYRSLVAGRRMLVVLDNARDSAQVVPLLPGSPSCTVLITSRRQLTGLTATHGAAPLALDMLPEAEAHELLGRHLGPDRLAAEPGAVAALLKHCAGLPLALSIVAARAAAQPGFPLAHLAEELAKTGTRLDALDAGDLSVDLRTVFASSYHALDTAAARGFTLLGLAPGPDISLNAAAELTGTTPARARVLLRTLETAHLIQQHTPDRYRMHDLVRLYAGEQGRHDLDEADRTRALRRLLDFYLHTAYHANRLLYPHWTIRLELGPPSAGCTPHRCADAAEAQQWFQAELPCLQAAPQLARALGWPTLTWQLPEALFNLRLRQGRPGEDLAMWRTAIEAAERLDDPAARAVTHLRLGQASMLAGRYDEARAHLEQALPLFERTGDLLGQGQAHFWLGITWEQQADPQRALLCHEHALDHYRAVGDALHEAGALNTIGWCLAQLGHGEKAHDYCEQALAINRAEGDRYGEALNLESLGYIAHHRGRYRQALEYYHQALTVCQETDSTWSEAEVLGCMGDAHRALGQHAEARQAWRQALDLYQTQHRTEQATHVQQQLNALDDIGTLTDTEGAP